MMHPAPPTPYSAHTVTAAEARKRFRVVVNSDQCETGSTATDFRLTLPKTMGLPDSNECIVTVVRCTVDVTLLYDGLTDDGIAHGAKGYLAGGLAGLTLISNLTPVQTYDNRTSGPTDELYYLSGTSALVEYTALRYAGSPDDLVNIVSETLDTVQSHYFQPLGGVEGISPTVAVGDIVVLAEQEQNAFYLGTHPFQNGTYTVTAVGAADARFGLTRTKGRVPTDTRAANENPDRLVYAGFVLGNFEGRMHGDPFLTSSPFGTSLRFQLKETLTHRLLTVGDGIDRTHLVLDVQFL